MAQSQDERLGLPSASSWRRLELCPGSYQLSLEAEKLGQLAHQGGEAAERGERIHAWLAGIPDEDGNQIALSDDEAVTAEGLIERGTGERIRIFGDQPVQQLDERRLWLLYPGIKKALSGRFDRVLWNEAMGIALIQDFKTGWAPPETGEDGEVNAQMRVLAVLVGIALPSVKETITQLVTMPFGIFERRWTVKDLAEAYSNIIKTLKAVNEENPLLTPGVEQCKYCPGSNVCPAVRKLSMPLSKFSITTLPEHPERAAKLLDEIMVLENAFEQIKAFYFNRLLSDPAAKITGYELVPNAPRREIEDVQAARQRLAEFLDDGELNAAMDLKVGQVEKLFGKKVGLKGKELREKFNAVMQGVLLEKTPNPSLKRTSGKPKLITVELP